MVARTRHLERLAEEAQGGEIFAFALVVHRDAVERAGAASVVSPRRQVALLDLRPRVLQALPKLRYLIKRVPAFVRPPAHLGPAPVVFQRQFRLPRVAIALRQIEGMAGVGRGRGPGPPPQAGLAG